MFAGPEPGQLKGGTFDCIDIPDAAMTLAVVAAFANSEVRISNVESWRYKETERMKAIVTELGKLGINVSPLHHSSLHTEPTISPQKDQVCSSASLRVNLGAASVA